jgi:hypothetical protein
MSRRLAILGIAFPVSRLVAGAVHAVALLLRLATGRRGAGLQLRPGVPGTGARSDGWCHGLWPPHPRSLPQTGPLRSGTSRLAREATGRVAASPGAAAGAAVHDTRPAASQRLGGATGGRRCLEHWTRQHRLPSTRARREVFTTIRIAVDNLLTLVSKRILPATGRRAETARPLISSCITDHRPLRGQKNDPHAAATAGGLATTARGGYGDV